MDMQRVMLPTVEEERESEESEYFWHYVFLSIITAKIGIIFNTHKKKEFGSKRLKSTLISVDLGFLKFPD